MVAALLLAMALTVLPAGLPFFPVAGALVLAAGRALALPRLPSAVWMVLALLAGMLVFATSLKGAVQFLACLVSVPVFAQLGQSGRWKVLADIPILFSVAALLILLLAGATAGSGIFDIFFVPDEYGGDRFRFLFSEPNHFVAFLFFILILCNGEIRRKDPLVQVAIGIGAVAAAAAAASPLGYLGVLLYLWSLASDRPLSLRLGAAVAILLVALLAWQFRPANVQARLDYVMEGGDNSLNFRTWGSVAIAATTLIDSGGVLRGVGIGGSRAVLDGNPYMSFFAADEQSVLPSFIATTMLEIGLIGLGLVVMLWTLLLWHTRRFPPAFHALAFAIANCLTGSFLFDSFAWSAFGLAAGVAIGNRSTIRVAGAGMRLRAVTEVLQ